MITVTLNQLNDVGNPCVMVFDKSDSLTEFIRLIHNEKDYNLYGAEIEKIDFVFTGNETRKQRTSTLLKKWRGHKNEWSRLHGMICMDHGWENGDSVWFTDNWIDTNKIARRLDKLNKKAMSKVYTKNEVGS